MQKKTLKNIKPGVNRRVHLFAAALLWTVVGTVLIVRGVRWIAATEVVWFVPVALVIGTMKSILVLDKSARRGVERIVKMLDGTCLGAVYSWQTWILVALMIACGILLRTIFEPGTYIGTLYCAIGWALLLSSRFAWFEWFQWKGNEND